VNQNCRRIPVFKSKPIYSLARPPPSIP